VKISQKRFRGQLFFDSHCIRAEMVCYLGRPLKRKFCIKMELNLDQKWQPGDLFYIIMNEIHHRFNQF